MINNIFYFALGGLAVLAIEAILEIIKEMIQTLRRK